MSPLAKRALASAASAAVLFGLAHLAARIAVTHDAAGALLSPAGLSDPIAWSSAAMFFFARLASAAMLCVTLGLATAAAARALFDRVRAVRARGTLPP